WALHSGSNLYTADRKSKRRWLCVYFNLETRKLRRKLVKARNPESWFHDVQAQEQERGMKRAVLQVDRSI
ncbi:MAG: hypothetical protein WAU82_16560, partial [Candidatus Binatus sp.]|uniref:hypothetical protein n=1 Tax=Candidatus Binatus sp. TaxID=2811406 RepID=UPI003BB1A37A